MDVNDRHFPRDIRSNEREAKRFKRTSRSGLLISRLRIIMQVFKSVINIKGIMTENDFS